MTVLPFSPPGNGERVALTIADARDALLAAANHPSMRREPYSLVLTGLVSTLEAQAALHAAATSAMDDRDVPMDEELRAQIVAAVERQVRKEAVARLNMAGAIDPNARRNLVLACAGVALLAVGVGSALFSAGWSRGGDARIAELCQGDAVREQSGGKTCIFWLAPPTRRAPDKS